MAGEGVKIQGAAKLRRTLKAAGDDLQDLKDANAAVAAYVAAAAAADAPNRTGALAASVRGNRAAASARVMAGKARVPYAGPIHWGWPRRNITPQPFMADAATRTEPQWLDIYMAELEKIIGRVEGA